MAEKELKEGFEVNVGEKGTSGRFARGGTKMRNLK